MSIRIGLLTWGLGEQRGGLQVTQYITGTLTAEEAIFGMLVAEQALAGTVSLEEEIIGSITDEGIISGTLSSMQNIIGIVSEEDPGMTTESNKIIIFSGDDRTLSLSVNQSDGSVVDLTGAKIWFTVKNRLADTDADALIQKRNTAAGGGDTEILVTDAPNGQAQIFIIPTDTEDVDAAIYSYDIQVILSTGKKHTITRSQFCVKEDVTKAIT